MNLEDQVVSLELARKLLTLGVKQNSYFSWYAFENPLNNIIKESDLDDDMWRIGSSRDCSKGGADWVYSAFTVAELGEKLGTYAESSKGDNGWYMRTISPIQKWKDMYPCKTEANARAKMLIYLLENKLMELPE